MALAQPTAASATAASATSGTGTNLSYTYFTVSISGPSTLSEWDDATYTAVPSYGTAPYTYTWFRNSVSVGTGSTYSVHYVRSSFTLQVNATDALGRTASATLRVSVVQECLHC